MGIILLNYSMVDRRNYLKTVSTFGLVGLAGCLGQLGGGGTDEIRIGFNAPLTGFGAADGQSAQQGAKLAENLLNQDDSGPDINLLVSDDATSADEAVPVAKDFINQNNVHFGISGSYSTPTRAVAPLYNQNQVPFISGYATHPDITNGDHTFRTGILAPIHGRVAAFIADKELNADTLAISTVDVDFGHTLEQELVKSAENRGIEIVYQTTYPVGESSYKSMLRSIKETDPDVHYDTGYFHEAALISKQREELGMDSQLLAEETYDSPKYFELAGSATSGTIISTNLNRGSTREATKTFIEEYRNRWDMMTDMVAANCYDAVKLAAKAVKQARRTDPLNCRSLKIESGSHISLSIQFLTRIWSNLTSEPSCLMAWGSLYWQ